MTNKDRTCSIDDCESAVVARGWCRKHYQRWWKYGDTSRCDVVPRDGVCLIDGCEGTPRSRGWCSKHYRRWQEHGDPLAFHARKKGICSIDECDAVAVARGWCTKHYRRWHKHGDPLRCDAGMSRVGLCAINGCEDDIHNRGWCVKHYMRWWNHGDPTFTVYRESPGNIQTWLYRLHGSDGRLLYVGITVDIDRRFWQHGKQSRWWAEVDQYSAQSFPTRRDAMGAEREAIRTERPAHNQHHNSAARQPQRR